MSHNNQSTPDVNDLLSIVNELQMYGRILISIFNKIFGETSNEAKAARELVKEIRDWSSEVVKGFRDKNPDLIDFYRLNDIIANFIASYAIVRK